MSKLPESLRLHDRYHFVKEEDSIEEKTKTSILRKLRYTYNLSTSTQRPEPEGVVLLDDQQQSELLKEAYKNADGDFELPEELSAQLYKSILSSHQADESNTSELYYQNPIDLCMEEASDVRKRCMVLLGEEEEEENNQSGTESAPQTAPDLPPPTKEEDIPGYIARQLYHSASPENPVVFGVGNRADFNALDKAIGDLRLRRGPADVPAYFDFHSVQLAFDHVWQELIDDNMLNVLTLFHETIEQAGVKPNAGNQTALTMENIKSDAQAAEKGINHTWALNTNATRSSMRDLTGIGDPYDVVTQPPASDPNPKPVPNPVGGMDARLNGQDITSYSARLNDIISQLENMLKTDHYSFTTYAANKQERSVNFGILVTYRQKWEPLQYPYQAGDLVKSIPLAPKEVRKYSKKITVKKSRAEKEIENSLRVLKTDSQNTGRAESEIMSKVATKSGYERENETKTGIKFTNIDGQKIDNSNTKTTNFTGEAARESRDLKKSFRENVFKSAQEYRTERKVEITTEETYESEFTESGEISNPNDELTVTYLFYELYRRYQVTERIHRLRPVVFVAQEMPKPNEIDEAWIISNDWIIRRVLLDDSFIPALNYLTSIAGDEYVLQEMARDVATQRKLVDDLRISSQSLKREADIRYLAFQKAADRVAGVEEDKDVWDSLPFPIVGDALDSAEGIIKGIGSMFSFGGQDDDKEAARLRLEAAQAAYQKAEREQKEMLGRLSGEMDKLASLSDKHNEKIKERLTKLTQIARLKVHIKQNILHYMHSIWQHEHPDQRFFRLHNVTVPKLDGNFKLIISKDDLKKKGKAVFSTLNPNSTPYSFKVQPKLGYDFTTLAEVADLDNLLGFKGNYMIFPLRKGNIMTDYMMAPYIESELGLKDPDEFGNWTLDEFAKYVCCLKDKLTEEEFDNMVDDLKAQYKRLLTDPLRQGEILVVPTGSLYIEALPGTHPILEDFKLAHRAIDVKKVQAEVREMELENIRLAARLLKEELEDPNVDKKIVVEGDGDKSIAVGE